MVDAAGKSHLPAHGYRINGLSSRIEVQRIDTVEELELHAALTECLVQGSHHDVPHAGGHLPENCALVLEENHADEESHEAGRNRRPAGIGILVAENQIVKATHQRTVEDIRMGAVAKDPLAEVFAVDGPEPSRMGDQITCHDAADDSDDKRYQQPTAFVLWPILVIDRITNGVKGVFEEIGWRALRHVGVQHRQ